MIKKQSIQMMHGLKLLLLFPVLALVLMTYSCQSDSGKTDDTATEMESEGSGDQDKKDMSATEDAKGSDSDSEAMDATDKKDMEDEMEAEVLTVADVMPTHPECGEGTMEERQQCTNKVILKYVNKHLKYPDAAEEAGIQGTVMSRFVVNKQGEITNVEIVNDIGGGCGDEVKRILNKMAEDETMVPGEHNGQTVNVAYTLPVKFKLD